MSKLSAGSESVSSLLRDTFVFDDAAGSARSDSDTFEGIVVAVWMVVGSESWSEVNEICKNILQCGVIDKIILANVNIEVHNRVLHKIYRSVKPRRTRS